jgi:hypothetical protein
MGTMRLRRGVSVLVRGLEYDFRHARRVDAQEPIKTPCSSHSCYIRWMLGASDSLSIYVPLPIHVKEQSNDQ